MVLFGAHCVGGCWFLVLMMISLGRRAAAFMGTTIPNIDRSWINWPGHLSSGMLLRPHILRYLSVHFYTSFYVLWVEKLFSLPKGTVYGSNLEIPSLV